MARKGKLPIPLPKGGEAKVANQKITVKGPKGTLKQHLISAIRLEIDGQQIRVELSDGHENEGHYHGLYRSLISNMVEGSCKGFEREVEMVGVGYRATVQGHHLDLQIGFSHPNKISIPEGMTVKVEKSTSILISGTDKQKVGQFAATVRAVRPPEPYQGKGIRYKGEYVRKKAGKAAAKK